MAVEVGAIPVAALTLAREEVQAAVAVGTAAIGGRGELHLDPAIGGAGRMGERFGFGEVIGMALQTGAGAGAEVVAVLGPEDRMVPGIRRDQVALGAVCRSGEGG